MMSIRTRLHDTNTCLVTRCDQ